MAHGLAQTIAVTFASAASVSSEVFTGRSFARIFVDPAGATNSIHFLVAPNTVGTTNTPGSYRLLKYNVSSGMSAPQTITVGTAVSGSYAEVPGLSGFQWFKIINVGGAADGATLKIVGSDL